MSNWFSGEFQKVEFIYLKGFVFCRIKLIVEEVVSSCFNINATSVYMINHILEIIPKFSVPPSKTSKNIITFPGFAITDFCENVNEKLVT